IEIAIKELSRELVDLTKQLVNGIQLLLIQVALHHPIHITGTGRCRSVTAVTLSRRRIIGSVTLVGSCSDGDAIALACHQFETEAVANAILVATADCCDPLGRFSRSWLR